jgi:ribosomal protein S18 acetylase RimI-like enzyme
MNCNEALITFLRIIVTILYQRTTPKITYIIGLYSSSNFARPTTDIERLRLIIEHSNLQLCAFDGRKLVGFARCLTDFGWCCYMPDLVVHPDYQKQGIGRNLIAQVHEAIGPRCMLLLFSSSEAIPYYKHIGLRVVKNAFFSPRAQ